MSTLGEAEGGPGFVSGLPVNPIPPPAPPPAQLPPVPEEGQEAPGGDVEMLDEEVEGQGLGIHLEQPLPAVPQPGALPPPGAPPRQPENGDQQNRGVKRNSN